MVNGEKFQSPAVTLTLIRPCQCQIRPSYFHILQYVQVSSGLNHYCLSYRVHRHTHTHRWEGGHTDGDEYSTVAVDKLQL